MLARPLEAVVGVAERTRSERGEHGIVLDVGCRQDDECRTRELEQRTLKGRQAVGLVHGDASQLGEAATSLDEVLASAQAYEFTQRPVVALAGAGEYSGTSTEVSMRTFVLSWSRTF